MGLNRTVLMNDPEDQAAPEIGHAAEAGYRQYAEVWGEAWGQYAARQFAKAAAAGIATEADPDVKAAMHSAGEAREHADRLIVGATGPDGHVDVATPEGEAAWLADHQAEIAYEQYSAAWGDARERHDAEVASAWREADARFMTAHHSELKAGRLA